MVKQIKDKYEFRKRTDFLANNTMRTTDTTIQQRYKLVNSNFSERANHETLMRKQGRKGDQYLLLGTLIINRIIYKFETNPEQNLA